MNEGFLIIGSIFLIIMNGGMTAAKRVALITGATDGIGQFTAGLLAANSYRVLIHGRSQERIENAGRRLRREVSDADIILLKPYDLSSIQHTKNFAKHVLETLGEDGELDLLINNAGVFAGSDSKILTRDGIETTFAVNVVAPYILFTMLMPLLKKRPESRIINVSSISQGGTILDKNYYFPHELSNGSDNKYFSSHGAYSHSKLCIAALNHELSKRITAEDSLCISCDPGTVNTKMLLAGWGRCGIEVEDATTQFELSTRPFDPTIHGEYFVGSRKSKCCADVYDDRVRSTLWEKLEEITDLRL